MENIALQVVAATSATTTASDDFAALYWVGGFIVAVTVFIAVFLGSQKFKLNQAWLWALGCALLPLPVLVFWVTALVSQATGAAAGAEKGKAASQKEPSTAATGAAPQFGGNQANPFGGSQPAANQAGAPGAAPQFGGQQENFQAQQGAPSFGQQAAPAGFGAPATGGFPSGFGQQQGDNAGQAPGAAAAPQEGFAFGGSSAPTGAAFGAATPEPGGSPFVNPASFGAPSPFFNGATAPQEQQGGAGSAPAAGFGGNFQQPVAGGEAAGAGEHNSNEQSSNEQFSAEQTAAPAGESGGIHAPGMSAGGYNQQPEATGAWQPGHFGYPAAQGWPTPGQYGDNPGSQR